MAEFFIAQTRRNGHRFPTQAEEEAALFYNYPAVRGDGPEFSQKYFFQGYPVYDVYEKGGPSSSLLSASG